MSRGNILKYLCISYAVLKVINCKPVQTVYNVDMAKKKINDPLPVTDGEPRTKILANGAVYDLDKKRIVANPNGGSHAITSERASEWASEKQARKRAVMAQAANEAVQRDDWRAHGDLAYVAAIADTAMMIATTPDSPKAIEAGRFLLRETGLSQEDTATAPAAAFVAGAGAMADTILRVMRDVLSIQDKIRATDDTVIDVT
jgi:hypothetical protein